MKSEEVISQITMQKMNFQPFKLKSDLMHKISWNFKTRERLTMILSCNLRSLVKIQDALRQELSKNQCLITLKKWSHKEYSSLRMSYRFRSLTILLGFKITVFNLSPSISRWLPTDHILTMFKLARRLSLSYCCLLTKVINWWRNRTNWELRSLDKWSKAVLIRLQ